MRIDCIRLCFIFFFVVFAFPRAGFSDDREYDGQNLQQLLLEEFGAGVRALYGESRAI